MITLLTGRPARTGSHKDSHVRNPSPGFVDEYVSIDDPRLNGFPPGTVLSQQERLELLEGAEPGLSDTEIVNRLAEAGLSENEANLVVLERKALLV
jgi:hypothetical protein